MTFTLLVTCTPAKLPIKEFQVTWIKCLLKVFIQVLQFFGSIFKKFPNELGKFFKNVIKLVVNGTNLSEISKENLKQFPKLEILRLRSNIIEHIPRDLFEFNKKLKVIDFSVNKIQRLDSRLLDGLKDLETFNIIRNEVEFIPGDFFKSNKKIERIYLPSDKIKFVGPELLDGLDELIYIDFKATPNIKMSFNRENDNPEVLNKLKQKIKSLKIPPELLETVGARKVLRNEQILPDQNFKQDDKNDKLCKKLHKEFEAIITRDDTKDFTIKLNSREFKVHKFLLTARSEILAEMIKNNPDADELILRDIPVEIFEIILKFLYTDETPKDSRNAREIFETAAKLKIKTLKEISAEILIEEIKSEENQDNLNELWIIFNLASKFEHEELKLAVFHEIQTKFPRDSLEDDFLTQPEKIKQIVKAKILLDESMRDIEEDLMVDGKNFKEIIDEMETEKDLKSLLKNFNLGVKFKSQKLKLKAFEEIRKHFPDQNLSEDLLEHPEKLEKIVQSKLKLDDLLIKR